MVIGTLGDIVFEVSPRTVKTFDEFTRGGSGRWATHDIIGKKPEPEFLGPGQEEISFSMRLSATSYINPEKELAKLRLMRDTGTAAMLIIGGKPVTSNLWILESLNEQHKTFFGDGQLMVATVQVTLKEYPNQKGATKK